MPVRNTTHSEGHNQNTYRGYVVFFDQHKHATFKDAQGELIFANGRPWGAVVERSATGASMPMPVGPLMPVGWDAPWLPDDKYMVKSIGRIAQDGYQWLPGTANTNRFRIDYGAMARDYAESQDMYYKEVVDAYARLMPNVQVPEIGQPIAYAIVKVCGRPPKSPKIPEAASSGNAWVLGFDPTPDTNLVKLLKNRGVDILTQAQAEIAKTGQESELSQLRADMRAMQALLGQTLAQGATKGDIAPKKGRKSVTAPTGAE